MDITGIGAAATAAKDILGMFFPDKTEEEKAKMAAAFAVVQGQLEINKVEAGSSSWFTSGWRPFIGWVCGMGCAWNWIVRPALNFGCTLAGHPVDMPAADLSEMMPLLLGMLGLGTLRTYEKAKGVAS